MTIHILPNLSRSRQNQAIKFGQVVEYNNRNIFPQKSCRKWSRETSSRPLFLFKKLYEVKASGLELLVLQLQYISIVLDFEYNKNKLYKTSLLIHRYAQFFCRKGFGNNFSTTFCLWFFMQNISHVIFY